MAEFTKGEWVAGYGSGVTGPTCPTVSGPTCGQATKFVKWKNEDSKSPMPKDEYTIVSKGCEVIAIVPFQEQGGEVEAQANARLIAAAKDLYAACKEMLVICERFGQHEVDCATQAANVADEFDAMGCTCGISKAKAALAKADKKGE